jgi:ketosteroid isomerase-like protein
VITSRVEEVLVADDIALVMNDWSLVGTAPDGSEVTQGGRSSDVLRRQPDGRWLVVVDKP